MNYLQLIPFKDVSQLECIKSELTETIDKTQMFRTRTEMEVSVLNSMKFPSAASKYWQAMREQNVHFTELIRLSYEYKRNQIKVLQLKNKIAKEKDVLEKKLFEIDLEELKFTIMMQSKAARERVREILSWSEIKAREAKSMTDEELSNVDNHQLVSYTRRWIKQSIAMGGGGSPSERQNLLGQLRSGLLACIKNGLFNKVIEGLAVEIQEQIKTEYSQELKIANKKRY